VKFEFHHYKNIKDTPNSAIIYYNLKRELFNSDIEFKYAYWRACMKGAGLKLRIFLCCIPMMFFLISACSSDKSDNSGTVSAPQYKWTKMSSGVEQSLNCAYAIDESHVWAVGRGGTILFYNGTEWQEDPQSGDITTEDLWDITAIDNSHVWVSGNDATIMFYDGSDWSVQPTGGAPEQEIWTISAASADDVWAGCQSGWYLRFDGTDWTPYQSNTGTNFTGIKAFSNGEAWALGNDTYENGNLLLNLGSGWTAETIYDGWLTKIEGTDNNNLWAIGEDGALFHLHSGLIDKIETGSRADFRGICVLPSNNIWVAGGIMANQGELLFYYGNAFTKQILPSNEYLWSVDSYDGSVIWVVGDGGAIFKGELQH
jgi:hypothetical protein